MLGASAGSGCSSSRRMRKTNAAEPTKLIALSRIAYGAVIAAMSTPASPGPASWAAERLISSFELPSSRLSRSTSDGRYD